MEMYATPEDAWQFIEATGDHNLFPIIDLYSEDSWRYRLLSFQGNFKLYINISYSPYSIVKHRISSFYIFRITSFRNVYQWFRYNFRSYPTTVQQKLVSRYGRVKKLLFVFHCFSPHAFWATFFAYIRNISSQRKQGISWQLLFPLVILITRLQAHCFSLSLSLSQVLRTSLVSFLKLKSTFSSLHPTGGLWDTTIIGYNTPRQNVYVFSCPSLVS